MFRKDYFPENKVKALQNLFSLRISQVLSWTANGLEKQAQKFLSSMIL